MIPENAEAIFDIRPPINIPLLTTIEWSIAGGIFLILALVTAWLIWRKFHKPPVILLPIDRARLQLSEIEKTKNPREAGHRLSECIRRYLDEDYKIDALEMTTVELACATHRHELLSEQAQAIEKLLEALDILRFSNGVSSDLQPLTEESKALIETLHSILLKEKEKQSETQKHVCG